MIEYLKSEKSHADLPGGDWTALIDVRFAAFRWLEADD